MSEPVKKRSLGSYMSRLQERREEREKTENKQDILPEDFEPASGAATVRQVSTERVKQDETVADMELNEAEKSETTLAQPVVTEDSTTVAKYEQPSAEGSVPLLAKSSLIEEAQQRAYQDVHVKREKDPTKPKRKDDEESSALSEVESDAPTEPASPPRPRKGRLIRGDQLESTGNSRQSSVPIMSHHTGSESDLSDLDDANSARISSSIIHEDSSPVKHSDLKRKLSTAEESQPIRKTSKPLKTNKPKKSVHRDAGGRTKLQIACDKGKYELAKKLIEEGYDVNDQDNAGNTPLHEAALNGHLPVVKLLVSNGADVNKQSYDMFLDTPLIDASANGHLNIVRYLLDQGADPTMVNAKGLSAIESIEDESDMDNEDREIVHDIKDTLKRATRKFVKHKHRNLKSSSLSRHSDDTERQLTHDEDFYWTDISSKVGKNKLLRASREGKLAYVGSYLENGGRPDFKCFLESCMHGHDDIVSLFLAFGAQVNMSNKEGQTPLMLSVGGGHFNVVKLLLEAGADPQKTDKGKHTVMYYAKHSPMGLNDPEEIGFLRAAIKKQYGYEISEEEHDEGESKQETATEEDIHRTESKQNEDESQEEQEEVEDAQPLKQEIKRETSLQAEPEVHHVRPALVQRSSHSSSGHISHAKSASPMQHSSLTPSLPKETEEERAERLKSEEEYRQKRLQQKKRKEQEFLERLAEDERKRIEEKEKQRQQELQKLEQVKQAEFQKQEALRNQKEVERRLKIRERYPIGLRVINFKDTANYTKFGPVYYFCQHGTQWVLDLQISVISKQDTETLKQACPNHQAVHPSLYQQLWNLYKFLFLHGGNPGQVDLASLPYAEQTAIEREEYAKFCQLPLTWLDVSQVAVPQKAWILAQLVEFVPVDFEEQQRHVTSPDTSLPPGPTPSSPASLREVVVPAKYLARPNVLPWINTAKSLW